MPAATAIRQNRNILSIRDRARPGATRSAESLPNQWATDEVHRIRSAGSDQVRGRGCAHRVLLACFCPTLANQHCYPTLQLGAASRPPQIVGPQHPWQCRRQKQLLPSHKGARRVWELQLGRPQGAKRSSSDGFGSWAKAAGLVEQSLTRMGEVGDPKAVAGESDNRVRMGGCFECLRHRRYEKEKDPEHSRS